MTIDTESKAEYKKCLIIDSYGFIFRAFHVQPGLTSPTGEHVGAIYGFTSMLMKLLQEQKPTHVVAVFDTGGANFRHAMYPEYKKNRPPAPQELVTQFPLAREVAKSLNICQAEMRGFEADDLIASIALRQEREGEEVIIVTADKDLSQLMSENIKIYDPIKSKLVTKEDIKAKFGVEPSQIRDVLALMGDSSDNIPGVPGFGPKTASELINEFGSFEKLCGSYHHINSPRKRQIFQDNFEKAKLSYELVGLRCDIDLGIDTNSMKWEAPDQDALKAFIDKYGFKSLHSRASKLMESFGNNEGDKPAQTSQELTFADIKPNAINSAKELYDLALKEGSCAVIVQDSNYLISVASKLYEASDPSILQEILEQEAILKITLDLKEILRHFPRAKSCEDITLMGYILNAGQGKQDLSSLFIKYTGQEQHTIEGMCINLKTLYDELRKCLFQQKLLDLYSAIDLPIAKILHKIEKVGVLIDVSKLDALSKDFEAQLATLQQKIFAIVGKEFNINSPKQLGEILFEDLKLPAIKKKGKSKTLSTNAEVLEDLAEKGYEIASHLLTWRQISKLKSTYTDSLPKMVNKNTGRVHTTLNQTTTTTGRLSSNDPNLQNIPIRTTEGAKIRSAIISRPGTKLICADYSQVELRILAEIANIEELKDAFRHNIDIHSKTASQIFGVPIEEVEGDTRRKAKAINFGIIYGISGFGLAKQLGISSFEATKYIEKYFKTYPGIEAYMKKTKEFAHEHGYVENALGRKCFLPQINSGNFLDRNFSERAAINAPIQGYASDIIKKAMIHVDHALSRANYDCQMILQVHDELVFECAEDQIELVLPIIKSSMENVAPFNPKLTVDIEVSSSWGG